MAAPGGTVDDALQVPLDLRSLTFGNPPQTLEHLMTKKARYTRTASSKQRVGQAARSFSIRAKKQRPTPAELLEINRQAGDVVSWTPAMRMFLSKLLDWLNRPANEEAYFAGSGAKDNAWTESDAKLIDAAMALWTQRQSRPDDIDIRSGASDIDIQSGPDDIDIALDVSDPAPYFDAQEHASSTMQLSQPPVAHVEARAQHHSISHDHQPCLSMPALGPLPTPGLSHRLDKELAAVTALRSTTPVPNRAGVQDAPLAKSIGDRSHVQMKAELGCHDLTLDLPAQQEQLYQPQPRPARKIDPGTSSSKNMHSMTRQAPGTAMARLKQHLRSIYMSDPSVLGEHKHSIDPDLAAMTYDGLLQLGEKVLVSMKQRAERRPRRK